MSTFNPGEEDLGPQVAPEGAGGGDGLVGQAKGKASKQAEECRRQGEETKRAKECKRQWRETGGIRRKNFIKFSLIIFVVVIIIFLFKDIFSLLLPFHLHRVLCL